MHEVAAAGRRGGGAATEDNTEQKKILKPSLIWNRSSNISKRY